MNRQTAIGEGGGGVLGCVYDLCGTWACGWNMGVDHGWMVRVECLCTRYVMHTGPQHGVCYV